MQQLERKALKLYLKVVLFPVHMHCVSLLLCNCHTHCTPLFTGIIFAAENFTADLVMVTNINFFCNKYCRFVVLYYLICCREVITSLAAYQNNNKDELDYGMHNML